MRELLSRTWREPAPTAVSTRINRRYRAFIPERPVKVNSELLASDSDVAIFSHNIRPRLDVVRIVMICRLLCGDADHDDEESHAQQNPTMNEAACFHVLIFS